MGWLSMAPSGSVPGVSQTDEARSGAEESDLFYPRHVGSAPELVDPFDCEYGTDTSALISGEQLVSGKRNDFWNPGYYGVSPSGFTQILESLDLDWSRFTFVDVGSVKAALFCWSRFPFRKIIGVELSPELSKTAAENILRFRPPWQRCRILKRSMKTLKRLCILRARWSFICIIHFSAGFKRCMVNLSRDLSADPREVYLLYTHPLFESVLRKTAAGFVKQWERQFAFSDEDRNADLLGATGDRVAVYRYLPDAALRE